MRYVQNSNLLTDHDKYLANDINDGLLNSITKEGFLKTATTLINHLFWQDDSDKAKWQDENNQIPLANNNQNDESSSPNFPNCSSPRESALVCAAYLRSHFSFSQPKALRSRARGYLSELRRATSPEECQSFFCSPFSPDKFLAAVSNLFSSTATGPDKVAYPMLKHLPRSGMDFLLHIFNLS